MVASSWYSCGGSCSSAVPKRYVDSTVSPACAITVDLDGHSLNDVFVLIPWDHVRLLAHIAINACVRDHAEGGISLFGLNRTFESIIYRVPYDTRINSALHDTVDVMNPDGSTDSVAVPAGSEDGISESFHRIIAAGHSLVNREDVFFERP